VRLFSALWPSEAALAHLDRAVRQVGLPTGVRRTGQGHWHVTLGFYGNDASQAERATFLDGQLAGLAAPTLRLAGAGTFPGVLWVGVEPVTAGDREALRRLAVAAGAGRRFQPHVTVARWRLDQPGDLMVAQLAAYRGPSWRAESADLVHSAQGVTSVGTGPRDAAYTVVHRVPLTTW
jgi:RNA 2',3'-cyclic 3'-phosphodiesterase